jgi:hypothetical protein
MLRLKLFQKRGVPSLAFRDDLDRPERPPVGLVELADLRVRVGDPNPNLEGRGQSRRRDRRTPLVRD